MTDSERNAEKMTEHGIETGQVRQWRNMRVLVLGPAETFPRNGEGLVVCEVTYLGFDDSDTSHYWPETLAKHGLLIEKNAR